MKNITKKLDVVFLAMLFLLQLILPFSPSVQATDDNGYTIIKTVKESIESFNNLTSGKDNVFMSGSTPAISFNNKDYQIFEMTIEKSGYYSLDIYYGAKQLSYKPKTAIMIFDGNDYVEVARAEIEATGAYSTFAYQTIGNYAFTEGTYKIKVYQPYADIYFSALSLTRKSDSITVKQSSDSFNKTTNGKETVSTYGNTPYVSFNGGDYQIFDVAVSDSGLYTADLLLGALNPEYRAVTSVLVYDGNEYVEVSKRLAKPTGAYSTFANQNFGYFTLKAGLNKIKVYQAYADIWFSKITVSKAPEGYDMYSFEASDAIEKTTTLDEDGIMKMSHAKWAAFDVNVEKSGCYMLYATASNLYKSNVLSVFYDDYEVCSKKLDKVFNNGFAEQYIGSFNLKEGSNVIKLKHTGTMFLNYSIKSIKLIRTGDEKNAVICGNTILTRTDAYNKSTESELLTENDTLTFDVNISEGGIYKVSSDFNSDNGAIGVSLQGKNIGKLDADKQRVFFFEAETEQKNLRIRVLSGSVDFKSLNFEKLSGTSDDLAAFYKDMQDAKTVISKEKVINKWKDIFITDFAEKTKGILSLTPVYAEMCTKEYDSVNEVVSDFYLLAEAEKSDPNIILLNGENQINAIESGNLSLNIKTKFLTDTTYVVGAIFENNRLYKIGVKSNSAGEDTINVSLGNVSLSNDKDYTLKVMYFENISSVKPDENLKNIYKELYVSENGNDDGTGDISSPFKTISKALEEVKKYTSDMTGDIIINVSDGDYRIEETLNITQDHSGQNGKNVKIRGVGENKPVIHGGKKIEGWTEYENGIYRAKYEPDKDVRNLYVNDFPAVRAMSEFAFRCESFYSEDGTTNVGINVKDINFPTSFARPQDLELVWELVWEAQRTPVTNVNYDGVMSTIYLNQDIISKNSPTSTTGFGPSKQFYLENAYELIDHAGEFYYNPQDGYIYYMPSENEIMSEAEVYVGEVENLVNVSGNDASNKVSDISFENLSFKYGIWQNVTENGFLGRQADCAHYTTQSGSYIIPAQFTVNYADEISVRDCQFSCLGSSALAYRENVSNSEIIGNRITDVSGTGIVIGSFLHEENLSGACENIQIKNNLIKRAAIEYRCCPGISVYYDTGIEICHNSLLDLPYTAISCGWGWGATECGRAGSNRVCHNYIENVMSTLSDGGGIYFLGKQNDTVITENYINNVMRRNASLYSDNGSAFLYFTKNVCTNSTRFATASPGGYSNYYVNNYTDTDFIYHEYDSSIEDYLTVKDNIIVSPDKLPEEAQIIKDNSGLDDQYTHLLNNTDIPQGKTSIINITPKRTYTNGVIYEAETYKAISDAGAGVVVYSNCLGISYPQWAEFEIDVDKAGVYDFGVYSSIGNATGAKIKVLVNGISQTSGEVISTGNWSIYTNNEIGEVTLPKGKVTLRINCTGGSFQLDCFTLKYLREN